jgi:deoxyribodipyrimidine photo-lyase
LPKSFLFFFLLLNVYCLIYLNKELKELNIPFFLLIGSSIDQIPLFVRKHKIGGVVTEFNSLRVGRSWAEGIKTKLPPNVPFAQVDSHNIVPCW